MCVMNDEASVLLTKMSERGGRGGGTAVRKGVVIKVHVKKEQRNAFLNAFFGEGVLVLACV